MLDTASLRVASGVISLTLLVLFYFVAYRTSRSAYCGWWCVALLQFVGGSAAYLLNGTSHQGWANPLGSTLLVGGVCAVWAGTRSLRGRPVMPALFVVAPGTTLLAAAFGDSATDVWAGGGVFLAWMSSVVALASWELWSIRPAASVLLRRERTFSPAVRTVAIMATAFSAYYAARTIGFLTWGPDDEIFERFFGSGVTTLFTTVLLATVSFGMTSLSFERETEELRTRATRDGLTGLLNRQEFMRQAAAEWRSRSRTRPGVHGCLIMADLDHFKLVNDTYGHPAGDYALQSFAATCRGVVRSTDLVGRYGGEEFIVFLPGITPERAEQVAVEISTRLRQTPTLNGMTFPTVSYGIASVADSVDLAQAIEQADRALYEAKTLGRDRVIRSERLRQEHEQA